MNVLAVGRGEDEEARAHVENEGSHAPLVRRRDALDGVRPGGRGIWRDRDRLMLPLMLTAPPGASSVPSPNDPKEPIMLSVDSQGTGKVDGVYFDVDRDGKWDLSYYDVEGNGNFGLVGYHRNGEMKPYKIERVTASR